MTRGEIWWVDFGIPAGSEPGYKRPVLVIQNDKLNNARLSTTIVLPITSNLSFKDIKGNVFLPKSISKLSKDSIILVHQAICIDRSILDEKVSIMDKDIIWKVESELLFVFDIN